MPELPEVETVRRGLQPVLIGRRIEQCEVRRPDLRWPFPPELDSRLVSRSIQEVARRNKHLLIRLDDGNTLMVHLGMSGRITIYGATDAGRASAGRGKHDHFVLGFDDGSLFVYTDPRRFGSIDHVRTVGESGHPRLSELGPEPTDAGFDATLLASRLRGRSGAIKIVLLDQRVIAGLGNIYVCEALHRAGISPRRRAESVAGANAGRITKRVQRLTDGIVSVIDEAIAAGGSTLRDFAGVDGTLGYFPHSFAVYDREGVDCPRSDCDTVIVRIVQSGRSTFYCPNCQR
jgi:formamidopyrimidine-DNA glycosylase